MTISQDDFRSALSRFASGVTVVTTKDGQGEFHGITVSAFCSVSLEPPLVLICIEKTTVSHDALVESGVFAVNVLGETQASVAEHFASPSADKFDGLDLVAGSAGLPILAGIAAVLECSVVQIHDGGDHSIFVGGVDRARVSEAQPLLYFRGEYARISY